MGSRQFIFIFNRQEHQFQLWHITGILVGYISSFHPVPQSSAAENPEVLRRFFLFLYILVSIFAALATGEVRLPGITMKSGRNQMALFAVTLILIACYMRNIDYGNRFLNHTMILTGFLAVLYSGSRTFMLLVLLIGFFTLFRRHGTFKVSDFARFSLIIAIGVLAFVGVLVLTEDLRLLKSEISLSDS